jgi:putative chitinase
MSASRSDLRAIPLFILKLASRGVDVVALQESLKEHGFDPGSVGGVFDDPTRTAVIAFQKSEGLLPDGIVGAQTSAALGLPPAPPAADVTPLVTVEMASRMFPATPVRNIAANLPAVMAALREADLGDKPMVLAALATIRCETAPFEPLSEEPSPYNTSPHGSPFDLYDNRKDLGNRGRPDGAMFRGRGYVQLTGRLNYTLYGPRLAPAEDLVANPERARDPLVAARTLALFLRGRQRAIRTALLEDDLRTARRLVNGGIHGLSDFTDAFRAGEAVIPAEA